MNRRLYRCREDRKLAGVAGGVAEYFDADPTIVRLLWVLSIFFGGLGLVLYVAMALIVPVEPEERVVTAAPGGDLPPDATVDPSAAAATGWHAMAPGHRHVARGPGRTATWLGYILILFGSLALVQVLLPTWADSGRFLWPAFIVGIGVLLVASAVKREPTEP